MPLKNLLLCLLSETIDNQSSQMGKNQRILFFPKKGKNKTQANKLEGSIRINHKIEFIKKGNFFWIPDF